ncbi:unnamed protein product [Strongylus vulgaris]|uniref:VWFA domain-containing protein n=1 Tax=Strongylus vulgaris TaxID=40348 RepID=A0A3P7K779_STRVU|nr:unnamed protein product [Strongylus vulgaris]
MSYQLQNMIVIASVSTGIQEATKQIHEREGARPGIATKVMIVFTDGWSNKGPDPDQMSKLAIAEGFEVYSVSYTENLVLKHSRASREKRGDRVAQARSQWVIAAVWQNGFFTGPSGKVEKAVTINDYTLETIAQDSKHMFTDKTFDQLIHKVQQRNMKCM